ncbi:hypothetical protein DFH07DRAFT_780704 [Mycena maculata]|uniref:CxC2-like cysteine cluster KDZ transposase-associated domain-containing protein n=1 Tax=Mycena maculata TaxID=230809 RepID=A0AAD7MW09_9AGAR|nr:hypothetical protein DFH07DRAFT_780704 [Mycena maculata]
MPFLDGPDDFPDASPAYGTTPTCDEQGNEKEAQICQTVAHMNELRAEEAVFFQIFLSLHYHSQLLTPCTCGKSRLRTVACTECLQSELLCPQCWVNEHQTMPTHWVFVWNWEERFFEKHDFCHVMKNTIIGLSHYGERCPDADPGRSFTLVDSNGIHATCLTFCPCQTTNGKWGIFPGSVSEPKTGYKLGLLDYHCQQQNQGKGSAYNFVLVLQRMADPFFAGAVPLQITMERGQAHRVDVPLPGEANRPYPNRPKGFLGIPCEACPEWGINMPFVVNNTRHLISENDTLDGNYKLNQFFKRDNGSDTALTDGTMYFPKQAEFEEITKMYVIPEEDTEIPCKARIGSIRHQGSVKYALSGVVACACDHAVVGSFVNMLKGEAFALGTLAQHEKFLHTNSPHSPEAATPHVISYDSYCSFVVNEVKWAITLFPEDEWLHTLLAAVEGQIPADHINGGHFHGEMAEVLWAFLNALGSSTRQMTRGAYHNTINFVIHAWNLLKVLHQAELLADERLDALRLFELHMAVLEDLSRQNATEVVAWSRLSRIASKSTAGKVCSVYQHESTKVMTIESMLAPMIAAEQERLKKNHGHEASTTVVQWIHDGISIECCQVLAIALLRNHPEHPLEETWATITKLHDTLNIDLKKFREHQLEIYLRLRLSALDVDEPELTAIQLPLYRMKHGQWALSGDDATNTDSQLREAEIQLRCAEADSGIVAVRSASLALSAVKKARDLGYQGQAGVTRSQRNLQKAELMKAFEITMYNHVRVALIHLGHMTKDAVEPYWPLSQRDMQRKETHLHRAKGDSRLFNGTAWYLQSRVTISWAKVALTLLPGHGEQDSEEEPQLLAGTQMLKRPGMAAPFDEVCYEY